MFLCFTVVVALVCFFAVWSVLGLAGFHTYLITANQTTNEDIKGTFSNRRHSAPVINPFSDGSYFGNCYVTLCGSDPPSLIDRRGFVPNDYETRPRSPASYGTVPQVVQNNAPGLSPLPNAPSN